MFSLFVLLGCNRMVWFISTSCVLSVLPDVTRVIHLVYVLQRSVDYNVIAVITAVNGVCSVRCRSTARWYVLCMYCFTSFISIGLADVFVFAVKRVADDLAARFGQQLRTVKHPVQSSGSCLYSVALSNTLHLALLYFSHRFVRKCLRWLYHTRTPETGL